MATKPNHTDKSQNILNKNLAKDGQIYPPPPKEKPKSLDLFLVLFCVALYVVVGGSRKMDAAYTFVLPFIWSFVIW